MECSWASSSSWVGQSGVWVRMRVWVSTGREAGPDGVQVGVEQ